MTTFTVIGDVMVDVLVRIMQPISYGSDTPARITRSLGGSASNTAAWLAALGHDVHLIAAAGDDLPREEIVAGCRDGGVHCHLERVPSVPTGMCIVVIDQTGERSMLPDTGANAHLSLPWCVEHLRAGHLHVSAYPLFQSRTAPVLLDVLDEARSRGITISLDLASSAPVARHRDLVRAACASVDVVFANADEARALLGVEDTAGRDELENALRGLAPLSILKLGRNGASAITSHSLSHADAPMVSVIDTTGAGDALAAGFLAEWHTSGDLDKALAHGVDTASLVLERVGAGPPRSLAGD